MLSYFARFEKYTLLSKLLFWEAVTDYGYAEDRSADRLLRMNQAWNIYNTFIAPDSPRNIGMCVTVCDDGAVATLPIASDRFACRVKGQCFPLPLIVFCCLKTISVILIC